MPGKLMQYWEEKFSQDSLSLGKKSEIKRDVEKYEENDKNATSTSSI